MLSFFYFIFLLSEQDFLLEVGFFLFRSWGRLAWVSNFGAGQKIRVNYKRFCPEPKFETLAALFDFLGCVEVFSMHK